MHQLLRGGYDKVYEAGAPHRRRSIWTTSPSTAWRSPASSIRTGC
ncbi:MAG: hypothetical protein ACLTYN_13340 [Dysosmobacter welbionis]